jgi:hypothetical protein
MLGSSEVEDSVVQFKAVKLAEVLKSLPREELLSGGNYFVSRWIRLSEDSMQALSVSGL